MRISTIRLAGRTVAARVDDTAATVIDGYSDVGTLLAQTDWREIAESAAGDVIAVDDLDYAPVVPAPGKMFCVGLNYASHIKEMGRELPEFPTLFLKVADALTGPYDDVIVPEYAAGQLDWEAELAFVIGAEAYQVDAATAADHIAGYSVINDYTMRDYQYRTLQWDQGKNFEKTSGFGPWLDTDYQLGSRIETRLDGEVMQESSTDDLVFTPAQLVEYISHIVTLHPGDVVIPVPPVVSVMPAHPPATSVTVRSSKSPSAVWALFGTRPLSSSVGTMCAADTGFHQLSRDEQMSLARKGTGVFVQNLARLTDDELREPSLLAEWSRAHLVAHVGYNAAALCNLMSWAASGTESPMYSSAEQRNSEIENGSTLPAQALRSLVDHTAARLDEAWRSLPADRWNAQVRTAQGRTVPVSEVIWMRSREVWIHSVDLDNGVSFADFGEPVLLDLRSDIVSAWRRSGTGGEIRLVTPDATIELDPDVAGTRSIVEGSLADVVAWMAGRANSVTDLAAPRWL